ncbi:MAG TPA: cupin domain-containing protein [Vicinamibacterales bacterium]|nr:cupin domain-containing protein [Vicinamibacterales bacterium]
MKQFQGADVPFEPADPRNFVGIARVKRLPLVEDGAQSVIVYLVEFQPGARTNWHRHSAPQLLLIKEGRGLVQKWGEPVREMAAGDAVAIEPNEKHWHGAAAETSMTHFAVNLNLTTEWLEPVSDDQYRCFLS